MRKIYLLVIVIFGLSMFAGCAENAKDSGKEMWTKENEEEPTKRAEVTPANTPTGTSVNEPTLVPVRETDESAFIYEYKEDGTIVIVGLKDATLSEIVIPRKIEGIAVTEVGERAFYGCSNIRSIVIQDGVTRISKGHSISVIV